MVIRDDALVLYLQVPLDSDFDCLFKGARISLFSVVFRFVLRMHSRLHAEDVFVRASRLQEYRVYPGFPTIFRGLSEFFVGDLMGKALWKLVENAQRFPRRGGRVLCVHGPVSFHRARPCATKWPPRRGLRTGPPASSDCGRPVNDKCSHQHRRSVQAERSSCPGKTVISGTYAIWETRI